MLIIILFVITKKNKQQNTVKGRGKESWRGDKSPFPLMCFSYFLFLGTYVTKGDGWSPSWSVIDTKQSVAVSVLMQMNSHAWTEAEDPIFVLERAREHLSVLRVALFLQK